MNNPTRDKLIAIRDEVGYSEFWKEVKSLGRERLDNSSEREKRVKFPWSKYKRLYDRCGAVCWWCQDIMPFTRGKIEIDHFDCNSENFNDDSNLGVLHAKCNREKGSKNLTEQAEHLRITTTELIHRFNNK